MNAEELRRRCPEAVAVIEAETRAAERERIRRIEKVARPGHEELIRRAKYEEPSMTAEDVARLIVERNRRIRHGGGGIEPNEEERR